MGEVIWLLTSEPNYLLKTIFLNLRLLRVTFSNCDGRTRTLFHSVDKRFDVDTDGTVTLKRQVTLHEGHMVFSVHAWDSSGKKHTVSVRVERVHHHEDHHMDTVMNISSPQDTAIVEKSLGFRIPKETR
ncbi:Cadherin-1 [Anabarilius grahami]|uniref:Cadherin-1 n=1 Tax=Anabarilius grahami TaxID=495550 RepID=A0A3N0XTJ3_ANAGA|nr:Cadherin-1 [Anabarilius grahami]